MPASSMCCICMILYARMYIFLPGGYAIELYRRRRIWTVSTRDRNTFINKENSPPRSLRYLKRRLDTRVADRKNKKEKNKGEEEREREGERAR